MEMWTEIRRKVLVEGASKRSIRRDYQVSARTLEKILANTEPPGYRQRTTRPKPMLDQFLPVIDEILESDKTAPPKQRHPLDEEELNDRDDSSVNNAAELFLAREFDLPYYYGPERLSRLASLNIQQFLGLAGEVFEESVAAELLKKITALPPRRQHVLMKKAAKAVWEDIPKRVRHGRELRRFLEAVGNFANWYTYSYRPTAPNDPGVAGTAIRMSERALLVDDEYRKNRDDICRFADILASALAPQSSGCATRL